MDAREYNCFFGKMVTHTVDFSKRHALPLFFLLVRLSVCYIVIAVFIPQNKDKESIYEVLEVIMEANPD